MRIVTGKQCEEISRFFEQTQRTARNSFARDGACVPVAIFMREEGNVVFSLSGLVNHKNAAAMILNSMIERIHPVAFVLVTEAWVARDRADAASTPKDVAAFREKYQDSLTEAAPDGTHRPKEGVREAVMLQCSAVTGENFMLLAEIVRDGEKPTLKSWERMDNRYSVGRFVFDVTPLAERQ